MSETTKARPVGFWLTNVDPKKGLIVEVANMNVRKGPGTAYLLLFKPFQGVSF